MHDSGLNKLEKRFDAVVARMAYANQDIQDDLSIDAPSTGAWTIPVKSPQYTVFFKTTALVNQELQLVSVISSSENQDSITQKDLIDNYEIEIQELIYQIKSSISIPERINIADNLLDLYNYSKEEDPDCIGIAAESLRNFYNFLRENTNLKKPVISLTPDYSIYASWKGDQGRVFSIHFLPGNDVHFVIFRPNDRHSERKIRVSGNTTSDILMETVASHHLYNWISK